MIDFKKILTNPITFQILILGIVVYIIIKVLRSTSNAISVLTPESINFSSSEIDTEQMKNIAEQVHNLMLDFGSNFDSVYDELKNLTGEQLKEVYNQFGRRAYFGFGRLFGIGAGLDLFGWFKKELDDQELLQMRSLWNNANTGLTLTF